MSDRVDAEERFEAAKERRAAARPSPVDPTGEPPEFVPSRGYLVAGDVWCRAVNLGDRCVNAEGHASSHQFVPGCVHPAEARWWVVSAEVCGACGATTGTDREAFDRLRASEERPISTE